MSYSLFVLGTCHHVSTDKTNLTVEMHKGGVKWNPLIEKDPILMNVKFGPERIRVKKWSSYPNFDHPTQDRYLVVLSGPCTQIDRCPRNVHMEFYIEPLVEESSKR